MRIHAKSCFRMLPFIALIFASELASAQLLKGTLSPMKVDTFKPATIVGIPFYSRSDLVPERTIFALARVSAFLATYSDKNSNAKGIPVFCNVDHTPDVPSRIAGYLFEGPVPTKVHIAGISYFNLPEYKAANVDQKGPWGAEGATAKSLNDWLRTQFLSVRPDVPACALMLNDATKVPEDQFAIQFRIPVK